MTMERPEPDLLRVTEVAERTGTTRSVVRNWIDRGLLPVAARPGHVRRRRQWVRWADVRAFGELYYAGKPRPAWLDEPEG